MSKNGKPQYKEHRPDYHKQAGKLIVRRADGTVEEQEPLTRAQVEARLYAKTKTNN
jgi:hypothetical protein